MIRADSEVVINVVVAAPLGIESFIHRLTSEGDLFGRHIAVSPAVLIDGCLHLSGLALEEHTEIALIFARHRLYLDVGEIIGVLAAIDADGIRQVEGVGVGVHSDSVTIARITTFCHQGAAVHREASHRGMADILAPKTGRQIVAITASCLYVTTVHYKGVDGIAAVAVDINAAAVGLHLAAFHRELGDSGGTI